MFVYLVIIFILFIFRILNFKGNNVYKFKSSLANYECGYKDIINLNNIYSSQFFVLALSFILFDLEIVFFLPFFFFNHYLFFSKFLLIFFLFFLLLRLFYEVVNGIV